MLASDYYPYIQTGTTSRAKTQCIDLILSLMYKEILNESRCVHMFMSVTLFVLSECCWFAETAESFEIVDDF